MIRPLVLVLAVLLAGCASSQRMTSPARSTAAPPDANAEVHRGMLTNQKSSPDDGQAPGAGSLGGGRGPGGN